jgi:hypothetical protein
MITVKQVDFTIKQLSNAINAEQTVTNALQQMCVLNANLTLILKKQSLMEIEKLIVFQQFLGLTV